MRLTKGMLLRVRGAAGTVVVCLEGTVWLTEEGDLSDHFLEGGHRHRIAGNGVVVLEALHNARLQMQPPNGSRYTRLTERAADRVDTSSVSA